MKITIPKINMASQPTRRERWYFAGFVFAVIFVSFSYILAPKYAELKDRRIELAGLNAQVETLQKVVEITRDQFMKRAADKKEAKPPSRRVAKILNRRPGEQAQEINSVVDEINRLDLIGNTKVEKVEVGVKETIGNYTMVPIKLEFKGRYAAMMKLLADLEAFDLPVTVDSIDIKIPQGSKGLLQAGIGVALHLTK